MRVFWLAFFLTFFFFVPIYRVAKTKGFAARRILTGTIAYAVTLAGVAGLATIAAVDHWLMGAAWLPVPLVLFALQLLPARTGAPGRAWLTITVQCSECGGSVQFHRDREGLMETCPECGEIFRIPRSASDTGNVSDNESVALQPGASDAAAVGPAHGGEATHEPGDWLVLRGYAALPLAEMDRVALENAGVAAIVRSLAPNAIYPTALGCELVVPAQDLERAESILHSVVDETPDDVER